MQTVCKICSSAVLQLRYSHLGQVLGPGKILLQNRVDGPVGVPGYGCDLRHCRTGFGEHSDCRTPQVMEVKFGDLTQPFRCYSSSGFKLPC